MTRRSERAAGSRRRSSRRQWARYLVIPAILLAGGAAWYYNAVRIQDSPEEVVRTVRVVSPERAVLEDRFSVRAFLEADETVTVLPLVSGTIQEMDLDVGDPVAAEEVIVRIDPARYELALAQAEASFFAAESTFQRTRRLYEADATTVQNYDHARAQYEAARSQRDLAQLRLGYTTVRSPVDGVVLVRHVAAGDVASPERPIVTVGDITDLVVRAAVPEERYGEFVAPGGGADAGNGGADAGDGGADAGDGGADAGPAPQVVPPTADTIAVRLSVAGQTYPGQIRSVGPYVAAETRTFEVVCTVGGDTTTLRPGMSVTVTFVLEARDDVLSIPQEAMGYGNTVWYVEEGRAWSMDAPDGFSDGERMEVASDDADRRFIVAGHHFLADGQPVEVIEAPE